jgi:succinoglycan biosynthesis transport protein ExoP
MTRIVDALQYRDQDQGSRALVKHKSGALQRRVVPTLLDRFELLSVCFAVVAQLPRGRPRIIEITSATHGEGTTTVARELALTIARDVRQSVLLITATSRETGTPGLEAVAQDSVQFDSVIELDQDLPLLSRATLSVGGPNAGLLFDFGGLDEVFALAIKHAKLIIIDAPPILSELAGTALARWASGVVLVVEAERTRAPLIEQARRLIENGGGRVLGAIMNKRVYHIPRSIYRRL